MRTAPSRVRPDLSQCLPVLPNREVLTEELTAVPLGFEVESQVLARPFVPRGRATKMPALEADLT